MAKKCQKEIYCINRQSDFLQKEKKRRREMQRIDLIILNSNGDSYFNPL